MKIFRLIKTIIPLAIFVSIAFFLWKGLSINPTLLPSALINKETPEFDLQSLTNPTKKLNNQLFLGHVSLLNVWATWCAACIDEYPILNDIKNTSSITIFGLDYKDKRKDALKWIEKYGNPFAEIGFDPDGNTAINWGVYGTPETFIIDKKGVIREKIIGEISHVTWQKKLLPLIRHLQQENT